MFDQGWGAQGGEIQMGGRWSARETLTHINYWCLILFSIVKGGYLCIQIVVNGPSYKVQQSLISHVKI